MKALQAFSVLFLTSLIFSCGSKETPIEQSQMPQNPLFREHKNEIDFSAFSAHAILEAADLAMGKADQHIANLLAAEDGSFDEVMGELDNARGIINDILFPMELVFETNTSEEIRKAAIEADRILRDYKASLAIRDDVYNAVQAYTSRAENTTPIQQRYIDVIMANYKRSGMQVSLEKREAAKALEAQINTLAIQFRANIAASKDVLILSEEETAGMGEDFLAARKQDDGTYVFDMSYPTNDGVMKYATSDKVRKDYRRIFNNRGMPGNVLMLDSIIYLRGKLAEQLDFNNFADYKTSGRMSGGTAAVWDFEEKLTAALQDKANQDIDILLAVKSKLSGHQETVVNEWEASYLVNILKETEYALDERELSNYFEQGKVIEGVFKITQELMGLRYEQVENPNVWHPDVQMFHCFDAASNTLIGRFYLDLYPRENKYSHAACFPISSGLKRQNGDFAISEAALVCNFPKPSGDKPSLMMHGDVETFFHEFGHLIHSMVAKNGLYEFSGIDNVMQDFVEAPSQIYENWAYRKEALSLFAQHYETGEVLSDEWIAKINKAKNLNSGLDALKQVFYGSYDMTLYDTYTPFQGKTSDDVANDLYPILRYVKTDGSHFQAAFGHLMHYAAGYYGYMWSKVYAQDMWSRFEDEGILNPEVGMDYRKKILESASAADHLDMVKSFLGRDPNNAALLKDLGVQPTS